MANFPCMKMATMKILNLSRLTACTVLLGVQISNAYAGSPSDDLVGSVNKNGYIAEPMMGSKIPCPCTLIGTARDGEVETVFIATKVNSWFAFSCVGIKGGSKKYLCTMKGQVNGGWTF